MDLSIGEDRQAIRDSVAAMLTKHATPERVRAVEATGFDPALWGLACELGIPAAGLGEEAGGYGSGLIGCAVIAEQVGRFVAPVPIIDALVVLRLLERCGAGDRINRIVEQRRVVGLAPRLIRRGRGWAPWGAASHLVIGLDGQRLLIAEPARQNGRADNLGSLPMADIDFAGAEVLLSGAEAVRAFDRAMDEWRTLTAAMMAGMGQRALELGTDYVKNRQAFGAALETYQTIQHRFADVATGLAGARLLTLEAAWAADEALPDAAELAGMAFLNAGDTAFKAAAEALHFHGGYGYTLEYDVQLYFRRIKAWALSLGPVQREVRRLAAEMFNAPALRCAA